MPERLAQIIEIIAKSSPLHLCEAAFETIRDLTGKNRAAFSLMQKWFEPGEAIARLRHFEMGTRIRGARTDTGVAYEAA